MYYQINLIKNKVLTPQKRRKIFLAITAYLAVCGLMLIVLLFWIIRSFIGTNNFRKEVEATGPSLRSGSLEGSRVKTRDRSPLHSSQRNLSEYNEELRAEIVQYLSKLQAIDGILSEAGNTAQLLQRISKALPRGSYIDNFSLDHEKNG